MNETLLEKTSKAIKYRMYILQHKDYIIDVLKSMLNKPKLLDLLNEKDIKKLTNRVEDHDNSKFDPDEFDHYRQYFYTCTFEEPDKPIMQKAFKIHYGKNDHHWEHWVNEDGTFKDDDGDRKRLAYIEMTLDWIAMGYRSGDNALDYYNKNKDDIKIDPKYIKLVETILTEMSI